MELQRFNLLVGGLVIVLSGLGAFALGLTYNEFFSKGFYAIPITRALLKAGHTHSMPFGLYNLIVALLLPALAASPGRKRAISWLAVAALIMPIGLILRGLTGGAQTFAPLGIAGGLCFIISALLLALSALAPKRG